jgi:putative MATE family efflux protein
MTQGAEWKHLLLFALPLMAGNALQQLYNTADGIIVGNFVGDTALAAVGASAPLTMLFVALAIGLANGSAVVAGQYYGAGKVGEMRRTVSTSIIMMVCLGAVFSVVGVVVARPMMSGIMSVGEEYLEYAVSYFSIYAIGLVFQFAYNIFAAILRALGDSKATLYFLIISSVTNIVLDLLFVVAFRWSVAGAAIATVISQAVSAVCAAVYMMRKHEVLRFEKGEFRFHGASAVLTMKLALPSTLQQCVVSCGNLAMQRIINEFGQFTPGLMAGTTAGMRVESFILIPIFSMHASLVAFTSQNVGAGKWKRVKRVVVTASVCVVVSSAVIAVASNLLAPTLLGIHTETEAVIQAGLVRFRLLVNCYALCGLMKVMQNVLRGAGYSGLSTFVSLLGAFGVRIMWLLTVFQIPRFHTIRTVYLSFPVTWAATLIVYLICWFFISCRLREKVAAQNAET